MWHFEIQIPIAILNKASIVHPHLLRSTHTAAVDIASWLTLFGHLDDLARESAPFATWLHAKAILSK